MNECLTINQFLPLFIISIVPVIFSSAALFAFLWRQNPRNPESYSFSASSGEDAIISNVKMGQG